MHLHFNVSAQQHKYEKEYRIKNKAIPKVAKRFIDSIKTNGCIKWYKEIGVNTVSIEAKFKKNKTKYSVEFDTVGTFQDVEFIIKSSKIPPQVLKKMEHKLDSIYQKWSFKKIQIHYNGNSKKIIDIVNKSLDDKAVNKYFEIVLKGKIDNYTQLYEVTFNRLGAIKNISKIIRDKADHLEY